MRHGVWGGQPLPAVDVSALLRGEWLSGEPFARPTPVVILWLPILLTATLLIYEG